jgi:hypothetical protein
LVIGYVYPTVAISSFGFLGFLGFVYAKKLLKIIPPEFEGKIQKVKKKKRKNIIFFRNPAKSFFLLAELLVPFFSAAFSI